MIIIYTGTNDIQSKVSTFQKIRKVITTIKEIDVNNEIKIVFSSVIQKKKTRNQQEVGEFL